MPKKTKNIKYYEAIGRRKSAIARVRLYLPTKGNHPTHMNSKIVKGDMHVNDMPIEQYFPFAPFKSLYELPLKLVDSIDRFAISIIARGGGKKGQLDAVKLGLARALEQADEENRKLLKPEGLLTRDARVRERRKPGTGGKARRKKSSPKR